MARDHITPIMRVARPEEDRDMPFVQRYPDDFDGVLAGAPGLYWNPIMFSFLWPMVPMVEANIYLSNCQLGALNKGLFQNVIPSMVL